MNKTMNEKRRKKFSDNKITCQNTKKKVKKQQKSKEKYRDNYLCWK